MSNPRQPPEPTSLGHVPGDKWAFDDSVTRVFGDMLRRSIPQYEVMRKAVFDVGCHFLAPGSTVVDLGCSRGDALAPFVERFGDRCRYLGLELAPSMLAVARERFRAEIDAGYLRIERADLRDACPAVSAALTLCVLTLHFTPPGDRSRILAGIHARTQPGGALVLVEKLRGGDPEADALMVDLYHRMKADQGYSREEVERKRLALEGVLVPATAAANEQLLRQAGFSRVECFWRWMNFGAWLARP